MHNWIYQQQKITCQILENMFYLKAYDIWDFTLILEFLQNYSVCVCALPSH